MEGELARICAQQHGFVLRYQARACGYSDDAIATLVKRKAWIRLRRGAYATTSYVESLSPAQRHVLVFRAAAARLDGPVVAAGPTALAALGIPAWGFSLRAVHVHRGPEKTARTDAGVIHHAGQLRDEDIREVDGLLVAAPSRSLVDAARILPFEAGVVMADGALRLVLHEVAESMIILEEQRDWPGSIVASRVLKFADGRSATVGESRGRVLIARLGLPPPELQRRIVDRNGELIATTDYYFEGLDTAGEFDGRLKYGRELYEKTGSLEEVDLGDVVWREKRREDAVRDEGNEMVRIVWSELDGHDDAVRARFLRAFGRGAHRRRSAT